MSGKRVTHILNGTQFLPWITKKFETNGFESLIVIIDFERRYDSLPSGVDVIVREDENGKRQLLELVNQSEVVFHYFLDQVKAEIIQKSRPEVRHFWCFFGADIYQQFPQFRKHIYGKRTATWMLRYPSLANRLLLRRVKYNLRLRKAPWKIVQDSFSRVEAILWYIPEEIGLIRKTIALPPFQFFRFFDAEDILRENENVDVNSKRILIGNSATPENNHLDVLEKLNQRSDTTNGFTYTLPLTYGQPTYRAYIIKRFETELKERVEFICQHIGIEEYYNTLNAHPTAIMLHYRQQALGNIFYLLHAGTKIYLSEKNVIYCWLKKIGIHVFSFEHEFEEDLKRDSLVLSDKERIENRRKVMNELSRPSNFLESI